MLQPDKILCLKKSLLLAVLITKLGTFLLILQIYPKIEAFYMYIDNMLKFKMLFLGYLSSALI
jgi:hypothetical protein